MFKKRKHTGTGDQAPGTKRIAAFAIITRKALDKLAGNLQAGTERLPATILKAILVLFCVTWGGISLYFVFNAFTTFGKKESLIGIQRIQLPKYTQKTGEGRVQVNKSYPTNGISRLQSFKDYMDSLNRTEKGRQVHDSILQSRPLLLDSINRLEIFQSHQK